jgi:hypothetical protein
VIVASQTQSFTFDNNTFVPFSKWNNLFHEYQSAS